MITGLDSYHFLGETPMNAETKPKEISLLLANGTLNDRGINWLKVFLALANDFGGAASTVEAIEENSGLGNSALEYLADMERSGFVKSALEKEATSNTYARRYRRIGKFEMTAVIREL